MNDKVITRPDNPCALCRKREVTQLCDFIVEYFWTTLPGSNGKRTCDLPMCSECAIRGAGHDFCPYHSNMIGHLENPDKELRRRTIRYKAKQIKEWQEGFQS